jgi:hypothetical protein
MVYARFVAGQFKNNAIFDLGHPWNRDNCFQPYHLLRDCLKHHGIQIDTPDVDSKKLQTFELHMDVRTGEASLPCYLLMLETPQVCQENSVPSNWASYRKVFTWRDDLVDGDRFIKINFPNPLVVPEVDGWNKRNRFCCLIASNKTMPIRDERILYTERVSAIRWFEQHAPQDFDLYGVDWNMPAVPAGYGGKVLRRAYRLLTKYIKLHPFPSYRGRIEHKKAVLQRTRFAICYENVHDLPGYITEKIFDCFFSGCIPVYWGANNVTDYIPTDCFIDRRQFADTEAVYQHLKAITEDEFRGYQQRIAFFLASDAARPFGSEFFAETIVNTIVLGNES